MTSPLTPENHEQVKSITSAAMKNRDVLEAVERELAQTRDAVARLEEMQRIGQREGDRYTREIKALGFHDIGHARGELAKENTDAPSI